MKSFARFSGAPFRLVVLCDASVSNEDRRTVRSHFPGAEVLSFDESLPSARECFESGFPDLYRLRKDPRFFTLPKVLDSSALRRREVVLAIDPDVLFFEPPTEMLSDLAPERPYFGALNLPRRDSDPRGAFCVDANALRERFGLELPLRFNCGLGSFNYARADWALTQRVLNDVPPDPNRAFMLDQTIFGIMCLAHGWRPLPTERYVLEPVDDLVGVAARHYFGKTRDLLYLEGIPRLIDLGLLR